MGKENEEFPLNPNILKLDTDKIADFILAEFAALRNELLKRTEIQSQLTTFALIAVGTLIPIGLQTSTLAILAYPVLGLFISAMWLLQDIRIQQVGRYIREKIENRLPEQALGWERSRSSAKLLGPLSSIVLISSRAILIGTQLFAILVALLNTSFPIEDIVLIAIDLLCILVTMLMLRRRKIQIQ